MMMKTKLISRTKVLLGFCFLLMAIIFNVSCSNDDDGSSVDDGVLRVLQQKVEEDQLVDGATNIPVDSRLTLIFSHVLDTDAILASLEVTNASIESDYDVEFSNSNSVVSIVPTPRLEYETAYSINLPAGTYGSNGESLESDISISFLTAPFIPPVIDLSVDTDQISESSETAIVTASLDKAAENDVTVNLAFGGTAEIDVDYTTTSTALTIPAGELSTTFEVTTIPDQVNDDNEIVSITIGSIENATDTNNAEVSILLTQELPPLSLKGVMALTWDGSDTNDGKAIHVVANEDIADLSLYSLGIANNGGGTDGPEYTFPVMSLTAGDDVLVARTPAALSTYLEGCTNEFEHILESNGSVSQNGDDAIELYRGDTIIEVYGDANVDGTGEVWEYSGSWAYKIGREWTYGGIDCTVGASLNSQSSCPYPICKEPLELKGVMALLWDGSGTNGGKAVHLKANKDIPSLSIYGIGVANNGGGTDGVEFTFPDIAVEEGDDIILAREPGTLAAYFGGCFDEFEHVIQSDNMNQNGDDAIELFNDSVVVETYGDADVDGTGEFWEYSGSWAYKVNNDWTVGGVDCADGSTTTQSSSCIYPLCE